MKYTPQILKVCLIFFWESFLWSFGIFLKFCSLLITIIWAYIVLPLPVGKQLLMSLLLCDSSHFRTDFLFICHRTPPTSNHTSFLPLLSITECLKLTSQPMEIKKGMPQFSLIFNNLHMTSNYWKIYFGC